MQYPEINPKTKELWTEEDFKNLGEVKSFSEMYAIAETILSRMPASVDQVCGPITTGGLGSIELNLNHLNDSVKKLQDEGVDVFDQLPFEKTIHRIFGDTTLAQGHQDILNDFYKPIFESGRITTLYFVSGWQSSKGAQWEHAQAINLSIRIVYL